MANRKWKRGLGPTLFHFPFFLLPSPPLDCPSGSPFSARRSLMPLAMLVEDNAMNRKLLRDILAIRFEVVEAETAERALGLLEGCRPDLRLVDLQLPGMDGLELMRRLKADRTTAGIPAVAISAHAMQEDIDQAMDCGCAEYVTKPLVEDPVAFVDRMARLAQARAQGSEFRGQKAEVSRRD